MFCAQDTTNCCLHKVPIMLIRSCKVAVNDHQINPESSRPLSARRDTWRHGSARAAAALHASTRAQAGLRPPPLWRTNLLENIPTHLPTTRANVNNKYLFLLVFLYVFAKISKIIMYKLVAIWKHSMMIVSIDIFPGAATGQDYQAHRTIVLRSLLDFPQCKYCCESLIHGLIF